MSKPKKSQPQTATDRKAMLLWPFVDFAEEGPDELAAYLVHVDITNTMIKYAGNVERAILAHYRIGNSVTSTSRRRVEISKLGHRSRAGSRNCGQSRNTRPSASSHKISETPL
jgi:hypothetical protein